MNPASGFERVYVHGAGRRGRDAWPAQGIGAGRFFSFPSESSIEQQVASLLSAGSGTRVILFAHSIGAVPAVLAAASRSVDVTGLVLVEPALYDIARGSAPVERHISIVSEARALAATGDLRGFWAILRPLMFGGPYDDELWDRERPIAQHWAATNLPWGHGVRASMVRSVPTLVVTGGWNGEYEEIAAVLTTEGARHETLAGAGHRPQDLPTFPALVAGFERDAVRENPDDHGVSFGG
ncbi:alpha/beta fold hydrolase [Microbacterium sp. MYb62]|uniref:alpha/beta fold hydrolase n=1 Tax=Microbacterium sp. MYb62 TaxID=1848690 RepID=UPI0015E2C767|nr:alpha/beta fold hydrolase [Microbacterium sp. MYb62]